MNPTTQTKSNALSYKTTKIVGDEKISIEISLADKCRNGHQDFSINGTLYEKTFKSNDSGCLHEEIMRLAPEFKIFIDLHLRNYLGQPMYMLNNGLCRIENGDDEAIKRHFSVDNQECEELKSNWGEDESILLYGLIKMGIAQRWKKEADHAIKILEGLTQCEFVVDSNVEKVFLIETYDPKSIELKIENGYYSCEQKNARKKVKQDNVYNDYLRKLERTKKDAITKAENIFNIAYSILKITNNPNKTNFIYYDHNNTIQFNWINYSDVKHNFTEDEIEECMVVLGAMGITLRKK